MRTPKTPIIHRYIKSIPSHKQIGRDDAVITYQTSLISMSDHDLLFFPLLTAVGDASS